MLGRFWRIAKLCVVLVSLIELRVACRRDPESRDRRYGVVMGWTPTDKVVMGWTPTDKAVGMPGGTYGGCPRSRPRTNGGCPRSRMVGVPDLASPTNGGCPRSRRARRDKWWVSPVSTVGVPGLEWWVSPISRPRQMVGVPGLDGPHSIRNSSSAVLPTIICAFSTLVASNTAWIELRV